MVAKTFRLILLSIAVFLVACQSVPVTDVSEQQLRTNQPEEIETAVTSDAGLDTSSTSKTEPKKPVRSESEKTVKVEDGDTEKTSKPIKPVDPEPTPEQVVTRLQQEALQLQSEGRWPEAELKLERALRINADKVDLYHQLATVRMGQERFAEAEQIALKGLTLTDRTPKYKASLWEVIAQCRSALGDIKGAKKARAEMLNWMDKQ